MLILLLYLFLVEQPFPLPMPSNVEEFQTTLTFAEEVAKEKWTASWLIQINPKCEISTSYLKLRYKYLKRAIQIQAVDCQILDVSEQQYIMTKDEDFENDLLLIRERWENFKNEPRAELATVIFPSVNNINSSMAFNRAYRERIIKRIEVEEDRRFELQDIIEETDQ